LAIVAANEQGRLESVALDAKGEFMLQAVTAFLPMEEMMA
jgi:hypothetical protein